MQFLSKLALGSTARQLLVARLAIFAVLLNAWAPTVTALVASATDRTVAVSEHCLAMPEHCKSMEQQSIDSGSPNSGAPAEDNGVSCPFCFTHAGSVGLTPVIHTPQVLSLTTGAVAPAVAASPPAGEIWLNAKPRGPPALS